MLSASSYQDRRVRFLNRFGVAVRVPNAIELPVRSGTVFCPHIQGNLHRFLKSPKTFPHGRKRDTIGSRFILIPSSSDTHEQSALTQNVASFLKDSKVWAPVPSEVKLGC